MSEAIGTPERQNDGSYRIPSDPGRLVGAVWGTVDYWAGRHGLLDRKDVLKGHLQEKLPWPVNVVEGGVNCLIFPEEAVIAVLPAVRQAVQAEEERTLRN